jgi:predicted dehydrogenase
MYTINVNHKMPKNPFPIFVIGAGSIVKQAHLPAYVKAGWEIYGIFDINVEKASALAAVYGIPRVFPNLEEAIQTAPKNVVFDIAVPASELKAILSLLPQNVGVLMQKPFGETIEEAKELLEICEQKNLKASVNFQMKFIPAVLAAKSLIEQGAIGELHDMEIRMNIYHPWELWDFLFTIPRMEMLYHSIHYMDMLKYFLGMPEKVYAKTFQHPKQMQLASTRSVIIFDYELPIRAFINTNHGHDFGLKHQDSFVKWEGTKGAIKITLGKNINFPEGVDDSFEYVIHKKNEEPKWETASIEGSWYPDAFVATMADLQCFMEGSSLVHETSVDEAYKTMQLVEAAYISNNSGGTPIPY